MDVINVDNLMLNINNENHTASVMKSTQSSDEINIPPFIEHNGTRYYITSINRSAFDDTHIEKISLPNKNIYEILMNQIRLYETKLAKYDTIEPFELETAKKTYNVENIIEQMKILQNLLLEYFESDTDSDDDYQKIINYISQNPKNIKELLYLLSEISINHHRNQLLLTKIQKIIIQYKTQIKQTFSIPDLFELFSKSKLIILFFLKEEIIPTEKSIFAEMLKEKQKNGLKYCHFFYEEINHYLSTNDFYHSDISDEIKDISPDILIDFDRNRQIGENESYICELIRNDSIEDFIIHVNKNDIPLNMTIKRSIFETNHLLLQKDPTLIEYAAFFGSIQIFQYLLTNGIQLMPSLWIYAIHSNNAEMIGLLEQDNVKTEDETFTTCLKEAIKCHHNDIANYILENLMDQENTNFIFNKNAVYYAFHYHNYHFFPADIKSNNFIFYYACKYGYFLFVKYLLETQKINLNKKIVFNFFLNDISNKF